MVNLKLLPVFSKLLISVFLGRNRPKRLEKQKSTSTPLYKTPAEM
jgi:hypothetical protein